MSSVSRDWLRARENKRQGLQDQFDAGERPEDRNRLGQFATPLPLARDIVEAARTYVDRPIHALRFLEPAGGNGTFYSALLRCYQGKLPNVAVSYEVDPRLAEMADRLWASAGLRVHNQDFTIVDAPQSEHQRFSLLITNPPYVRHHHLQSEEKERMIARVRRELHLRPSGLMGLYGYFLLFSHNWLQENGLGVWLIPSEFMDVGYGDVIKNYLLDCVELLRVHRFNPQRQFFDADVTSTVLFLRKRRPVQEHRTVFSWGANILSPESSVHVKRTELQNISKWSLIGQYSPPELLRHQADARQAMNLGYLFSVKRGLVTGANKFFIMTRDEARERGIPEAFLRPIMPSPRYLGDQRIIEAAEQGLPKVEPQLFLLDCELPKDYLAAHYPQLYAYILEGESLGLPDRYLLSRRNPWYSQEARAPAPILCGYMGRSNQKRNAIRFYRNKSEAIASNIYLMLYPKPLVTEHCIEPEAFFDRIFTLLSSFDEKRVTRHGRTYGGGLRKIEPGELSKLVLPTADIEELLAQHQCPQPLRLF